MTFDKQGIEYPLFSNYQQKAEHFKGSHNIRQFNDSRIKKNIL